MAARTIRPRIAVTACLAAALLVSARKWGELGDNRASSSRSPVRVQLPGRASAVAAGLATGYALLSDGTV